jgi:hypothetical protein
MPSSLNPAHFTLLRSLIDFKTRTVDPEAAALIREKETLEKELRDLSDKVKTAEQAWKIESEKQDHELERLVEKWTNTSRRAASELFNRARDRISLWV